MKKLLTAVLCLSFAAVFLYAGNAGGRKTGRSRPAKSFTPAKHADKDGKTCAGERTGRNFDCLIKDNKNLVDKLGYPWNALNADWEQKCTEHAAEVFVCSSASESSVSRQCAVDGARFLTTSEWRFKDLWNLFPKYTIAGNACPKGSGNTDFFFDDRPADTGARPVMILRCCPNVK